MGFGKYCSKKCFKRMLPVGFGFKRGDKHKQETKIKIGKGNFKTGIVTRDDGYQAVLSPTHPFTNKNKYIYHHRLIMEKHIGRYLKPREVVHHINSDPSDNRIENLMLFSSHSEHQKFHNAQAKPKT